MKKHYFKPIVIILSIIFATNTLFAQPMDNERAKQRIMTMKKIKVLEILNLSEEKSDKFLAKYNVGENKIMSISEKIDEATRELHQTLDAKSAKASDLKQRTDAIIKLQDELHNAMSERTKGIQSVLSEEEFAKYMLFERRFNDELRRHIMERPNRGKGRNFDGDEPPRFKKNKR